MNSSKKEKENEQYNVLSQQSQSKILSQIEILSLIKESKYPEALNGLTYYQSLKNTNKTSNNWNIFLIKMMQENQLSNAISPSLGQSVQSYFSSIKDSIMLSLPITKLNEIIFYFRIGQFLPMITKFRQNIIHSYFDYILFVNSTLLLIETCLLLNFNSISGEFIMILEKYFEDNIPSTSPNITVDPNNQSTILEIALMFNYDKAISEYFDSNETFHKDTNMNKEIILLLKCYLNLNQNQCDKAKKNLDDFKSIYSTSQLKKSLPMYVTLKKMYNVLKVKLDFLNNSQFKCYKHINSLNNSYDDKETRLFKYNSYGILNLKLKKVKYAEYYFKEAFAITRENTMLMIKYWHVIVFNLALCDFYLMQFDKCYERLKSLKNNEVMNNNPFYFYRLGLCCVEREFIDKRKKNSERIENDLVEKYIRFPPIYPVIEVSTQGNVNNGNSRIINNQSPKHEGILLRNIGPKPLNTVLTEAIEYFKRCILLLKGYNAYKGNLSEILKEFSKGDKTNNFNWNSAAKTKLNHEAFRGKPMLYEIDSKKSFNKVYTSSISHLLFCLLLTERFTEVIYYGKEYEKDSLIKKENYFINNYMAEAYFRTGQIQKALKRLLTQNLSNDIKVSFYSKINNCLYSDANYQIALRLNIIKLNFIQGQTKEVEQGINQLIQITGIRDLPPYVANVLVYYCLANRRKKEAIDLLLYRRIPGIFNKNESKHTK